ncbi:uncharacterized protein EI90DRAFT_3118885 [Cantharellus anzutake]|uniref:uncharacterized protein n=1 Tax=Cantharellus anzutake TaxID=1750568 RepID=UPI00190366F9|nr:uncharacterized protein EI90DRAFT_3118885 [Cantharellus anzutake]KAF8337432.1 hypothetical protein EI90DRAFT_3118885 [Cantharellus anzutake]
MSLKFNNPYSALSNLGRHAEALLIMEESVKLYRQLLVVVHPGSSIFGLFMSLSGSYSALSSIGRHCSDALAFIEECFGLYPQLVPLHPEFVAQSKMHVALFLISDKLF